MAAIGPSTARGEIEEKLAQVEECKRYIRENDHIQLAHLQDPQPVLANLAIHEQVLEPCEFLALLDLCEVGKELQKAFQDPSWPHLGQKLKLLPKFDFLIREIKRAIDRAGAVRESADSELATVRQQQSRFKQKLREHLSGYFTGPQAKFLISEPFVTVRNGRYVIPVRIEHQHDLPGVIHGSSSSGATLFIEPFAAIELNNQCLYHQDREREIILRVLRQLTERLRPHQEVLQHLTEIVAQIDLLFACAEFSIRYRCITPRLQRIGFSRSPRWTPPPVVRGSGRRRCCSHLGQPLCRAKCIGHQWSQHGW